MSSANAPNHSTRLIVLSEAEELSHAASSAGFAEDVRAGLTAQPKKLLPKYFYDALGSLLFEAICHLPEYYPTRAETEIFEHHARNIIHSLPAHLTMVELGSGSSVKTRRLIETLLARQPELHYQPIDISRTILEQSANELLKCYPALRITAQARDYTKGLHAIERAPGEKVLLLFLGSNIGNYDPPEAIALLQTMRNALQPGDALLLGADLKKDVRVLEAAYDDALGVTAAFNLNLLLRMNRELGADFELKHFAHRAFFNDAESRIEMHLVSRVAQTVTIDALKLQIAFAEGETIHTENSHKYDSAQLAAMAAAAGFKCEKMWLDAEQRFSSNLWLAA